MIEKSPATIPLPLIVTSLLISTSLNVDNAFKTFRLFSIVKLLLNNKSGVTVTALESKVSITLVKRLGATVSPVTSKFTANVSESKSIIPVPAVSSSRLLLLLIVEITFPLIEISSTVKLPASILLLTIILSLAKILDSNVAIPATSIVPVILTSGASKSDTLKTFPEPDVLSSKSESLSIVVIKLSLILILSIVICVALISSAKTSFAKISNRSSSKLVIFSCPLASDNFNDPKYIELPPTYKECHLLVIDPKLN